MLVDRDVMSQGCRDIFLLRTRVDRSPRIPGSPVGRCCIPLYPQDTVAADRGQVFIFKTRDHNLTGTSLDQLNTFHSSVEKALVCLHVLEKL